MAWAEALTTLPYSSFLPELVPVLGPSLSWIGHPALPDKQWARVRDQSAGDLHTSFNQLSNSDCC